MKTKEKTLHQMYDKPYIKQEAQSVLKGEIGYAYTSSQLKQIQAEVELPTEVYACILDNNNEPVVIEDSGIKPFCYLIKLLDNEIELIAYKQERLQYFKDIEVKVPLVLKKKLESQHSITSVNRVWNEIYDALIK